MPAILMLVAALAAAGGGQVASKAHGPRASAQAASVAARDRATNQELLAALRKKRAEVARMPEPRGLHHGQRRYALWFLDRQIAKVEKDLGR